MTDYDVIVVGCGPAGLMAVAELKKRNIKVLGVDKKPRLNKNIRTASGFCFTNQLFNNEYIKMEPQEDKTILHYTKCGFTIEYSAPMEPIYHSHMFSDTGKHWQATVLKKPFYNTFVPHRWLADRYNEAKKHDVPFLTGTIALKAKQNLHDVEVTVRTNGRTRILTCKKLIAADGLSSRIASFVGVNKKRTVFGKGPTIEFEMCDVNAPYDRGDMFFFGENNFGGRPGGIIMVPSPNGKNAYRVETMSVLPASSATEIIEYFTQKSPFASWFKKATILEKSGAIVEMMTPLATPYLGNILFAGDVAAYAECLYQGATMCGYMAAVCTEQELKEKKGFDEYTNWWMNSFEWNKNPKRMADYSKRVLFPRFFSHSEIDFLFELSEKNPIIVDEATATPYDFTKVVMEQFLAMDEVQGELRERMKNIINADMSTLITVIGRAQKKD